MLIYNTSLQVYNNVKLKKLQIVQNLPLLLTSLLSMAQCYEKKSSSTHFVHMFNWISHNEKCIANYFTVWVLVFLVNSSRPWLVTYTAEKYCHTLHNFKINGTRTRGSYGRVAVFSDIVQCTYSSFKRIYIDKLIGNAIC